MKGSPEMTASCAPAGRLGGTGPHFTSSALIGGRTVLGKCHRTASQKQTQTQRKFIHNFLLLPEPGGFGFGDASFSRYSFYF